jgi:hypothetical protein
MVYFSFDIETLAQVSQKHSEARMSFQGVKVFSATKAREREEISNRINDWLASNEVEVVDDKVTQSSDREFHCLTITIFYNRK